MTGENVVVLSEKR